MSYALTLWHEIVVSKIICSFLTIVIFQTLQECIAFLSNLNRGLKLGVVWTSYIPVSSELKIENLQKCKEESGGCCLWCVAR
jgi:hypothetical protein